MNIRKSRSKTRRFKLKIKNEHWIDWYTIEETGLHRRERRKQYNRKISTRLWKDQKKLKN